MTDAVLAAIVTGALAVLGSWVATRAAYARAADEHRGDLLSTAERMVREQMARMAEEIADLRASGETRDSDIAALRRDLDASRRAETRLVAIVRQLLTALRPHDAPLVDRIRAENPDLSL